MPLPKENHLRKALPVFTFLTQYFPDAILELVRVSMAGNLQHNPGEPMHWARGKSMDQLNTAMRHILDYGAGEMYNDFELPPEVLAAIGGEPPMHLANAAWRLLAQIQLDCEARAAAQDAASAQESYPQAYELTPDPLQPEERIVGMMPELAAGFTPVPVKTGEISPFTPGRLKLECGCFGGCKGHSEKAAEDIFGRSSYAAERAAHISVLVPVGTGPKDPAGVAYSLHPTVAKLGPVGDGVRGVYRDDGPDFQPNGDPPAFDPAD